MEISMRPIVAAVFMAGFVAGTSMGAEGPKAGKAAAGRFVYKVSDTWKLQETMVMAKVEMPGMESGAQMPQASSAVMTYVVEKVFPNGSALVSKTPVSCSNGPSLKELKDAPLPNGGKPGYMLCTRDGRIFMVQGKMTSEDPAQQAMMDESGNTDEVALLKSSKTTAEFLKVMRNQGPLDAYRVPAKVLKVGGKTKIEGYDVARIKDEALDGVTCEVYRAVMDPMVETIWFDARAGRVVKRTIVQGDPAQMEVTQVVVK